MWDNGTITDAGAITLCNGGGGTVGIITASNSLIGSTMNDHVGGKLVSILSNGNYVAATPEWDNGTIEDVGAVTWGSSITGTVGVISASNSLIGSTAGDFVGGHFSDVIDYIKILSNGNYVVISPDWDNG